MKTHLTGVNGYEEMENCTPESYRCECIKKPIARMFARRVIGCMKRSIIIRLMRRFDKCMENPQISMLVDRLAPPPEWISDMDPHSFGAVINEIMNDYLAGEGQVRRRRVIEQPLKLLNVVCENDTNYDELRDYFGWRIYLAWKQGRIIVPPQHLLPQCWWRDDTGDRLPLSMVTDAPPEVIEEGKRYIAAGWREFRSRGKFMEWQQVVSWLQKLGEYPIGDEFK